MAKATAPVAMQFKRPGGGQAARAKQQQKRKAQRIVEIVRPWTAPQFEELAKEERDIVLDRLQKEVADVPATRSYAVRGVNQVAKAVARGEVRVVVFANNPESLAFGHLPLLCRLHQVPICVLHLSSKTFGRLFQLKSMVAVGLRAPRNISGQGQSTATDVKQDETKAEGVATDATTTNAPMQLTEAEQKKLASITEFLVSKASKRTTQ